MAQWHFDQLDFIILEQCGGDDFPLLTFPPPLFAEIIKTNHLRMRAAAQRPAGAASLRQEAFEVLNRIGAFSIEEWAGPKPCSEEGWLAVGNIYKSAVTMYCVSSLQGLSILPQSDELRAFCAAEGRILQGLLTDTLSTPGAGAFMLWPLVMLGMEAVNGPSDRRRFVEQRLPEMSRHVGSHAPLTALQLLKRYWASGERSWDACFDRPYAFTCQVAVDLSRLSPP